MKPSPIPTMSSLCAMLNCTPEQIRAQYAKNIASLESMLATAKSKPAGVKYRGLLASEWQAKVDAFKIKAREVCES